MDIDILRISLPNVKFKTSETFLSSAIFEPVASCSPRANAYGLHSSRLAPPFGAPAVGAAVGAPPGGLARRRGCWRAAVGAPWGRRGGAAFCCTLHLRPF